MTNDNNVHEGHRERMTEKLLANPNGLYEHEILEVLLYPLLPRVDTNPIAHDLITAFGSLAGVLNAKAEELVVVKGIGKRTASAICLLGSLLDRVTENKKKTHPSALFTVYDILQEVSDYFANAYEERFLVVLLDKSHKHLLTLNFADKIDDQVTVDVPTMLKAFSVKDPYYVVLVHNHPSGNVSPSPSDDFTTQKTNLICEIHGVNVLDHIIVHKDKHFSYHQSGRLEYVKKSTDLNKILKELKE